MNRNLSRLEKLEARHGRGEPIIVASKAQRDAAVAAALCAWRASGEPIEIADKSRSALAAVAAAMRADD
jgi:hypothetical protein